VGEGVFVATISKTFGTLHETDVVFTVKRLTYGGYAVLVQDDIDYPSRHVCDFYTEYEARLWIRENAHKHMAPPARRSA
jgi:hypothetical protein